MQEAGFQQLTAETGVNDQIMPASQELRQREAANMSWRGHIWASAPLGLSRGARANPARNGS